MMISTCRLARAGQTNALSLLCRRALDTANAFVWQAEERAAAQAGFQGQIRQRLILHRVSRSIAFVSPRGKQRLQCARKQLLFPAEGLIQPLLQAARASRCYVLVAGDLQSCTRVCAREGAALAGCVCAREGAVLAGFCLRSRGQLVRLAHEQDRLAEEGSGRSTSPPSSVLRYYTVRLCCRSCYRPWHMRRQHAELLGNEKARRACPLR